jgi:hypothetical protein
VFRIGDAAIQKWVVKMKFWSDLWSLLTQCVLLLELREPRAFLLTLLIGVGLAAAFWWACSGFSRLWNTRWQLKPLHHCLCALAALLTFTAATLFASLRFAKDAALQSIENWQSEINHDAPWEGEVFQNAYNDIKAQGKEDFSAFPPPSAGGNTVPVSHPESKFRVAEIYADAACKHFTVHHAFLGRVIWPPASSVPRDIILSDVNAWFQAKHESYMLNQAVALAASQIRSKLESQTPRVVYVSRFILFGIFLVAQAVPFGLIGYGAYQDLKVMT